LWASLSTSSPPPVRGKRLVMWAYKLGVNASFQISTFTATWPLEYLKSSQPPMWLTKNQRMVFSYFNNIGVINWKITLESTQDVCWYEEIIQRSFNSIKFLKAWMSMNHRLLESGGKELIKSSLHHCWDCVSLGWIVSDNEALPTSWSHDSIVEIPFVLWLWCSGLPLEQRRAKHSLGVSWQSFKDLKVVMLFSIGLPFP
jgi:hypothetical protein